MVAPIIIWTFRRTGGTNLAEAMFQASECETVPHEPFNTDRCFGYILQDYMKNKDLNSVYASLDEVVKKKYLIKHCLELMPLEFNIALMEVCCRYGYRHLFLYREEAKDRLLSLNYAQKTGIWGKDQRESVTLNPSVFDEPIDVNFLLNHEQTCQKDMTFIFEALVALKQNPLSVSFENLYTGDIDYSKMLVTDLFSELNLDMVDITEDVLTKMLRKGSQGTKSDYLQFPCSDEFVNEVEKLPSYSLHHHHGKSVEVFSQGDALGKLNIFFIKPAIYSEKYHFIGTFLTNENGHFYIDWFGEKVEFIRNLKSPNLGKQFPDNPGALNARFVSKPTSISGGVRIIMNYKVVARVVF